MQLPRVGHETFGVVEAVGPKVRSVKPGDYVTATVRRPGGSIYDQIGTYDMTSEETYYERGINLLHGFLTEKIRRLGGVHRQSPARVKTFARAHGADELRSQRNSTSLRGSAPHASLAPSCGICSGRRQIGLLATLLLKTARARCVQLRSLEATDVKF